VIYDPTDQPKIIAFVLPNQASNRPLEDFAVSPDKAEELTGFDFFSQLPDDQERKLEGNVQLEGWFEGYKPQTIPETIPEVKAEKQPEVKPEARDSTFTKEKVKEKKGNAPFNINIVLIILFCLFVIIIVVLIVTFKSSKRK